MIKMVVSSFYNTIINSEEAIPNTTMLEIERIRNKKILFSICTNRSYQEVLDYNKDFPFIDYIISLNGSYIYDVNKERCIFKKKISLANIKKVNKLFEGYNIIYYTGEETYNDSREIEDIDIYKIEVEINDREEISKLDKLTVNSSIIERDNKMYLEIISNKTINLIKSINFNSRQ